MLQLSRAIRPLSSLLPTAFLAVALFVLGVEGTRKYCQTRPELRVIMTPATEDGEPQGIRINFPDQ